ncbi:ras gtpase-activating protein [Anaeramoeba flamelloides]|uniref:Ras gtpase-activating protein n=1 Tax=Anaeramoeba flamelloides TaxID=1746091 RepID=A0AAV7ZNG7_9EUKA|nr:ras gtpase-activating protein [Anaeramoeba flamelloides]
METEQEQPQLFLEISQAKNLPLKKRTKTKKRNFNKVYCQAIFNKKKLETDYSSCLKPVWNEQFLFFVCKPQTAKIKINICYQTGRKKSTVLGFVEMPIQFLSNEQPVDDWFDLSFPKSNFLKKSKKEELPNIRKPQIKLKLHYTFTKKHLDEEKKETQWRKGFKSLIDFILKDSNLILTTLTDIVHSGDTGKVSKVIVSVLRHYQKIVPFINYSIDREVQKTDSPQQLFRTNSMSTKMMTELKTPSISAYIASILKKPLQEILKTDKLISLQHGNNPLERKKNHSLIEKIISKIMRNVFNSYKIIPWEYQEICSHMYGAVKKKFPEHAFISVAGFIFLRVLSPAIINPSSFLKLKEPITPNQLKNLILIAKIIQTFVNGIEFGIKDESLKPFNKWSNENRSKLNEFILKISTSNEHENENGSEKGKGNTKETNPYIVPSQDLIELLNIFKKYYNAMSTILYVPEEKNNEESMSLFLKADDPSIELAIFLNNLKVPESPLGKKSHKISNLEILQKKAIKITHKGSGTELLTEEEEDPDILNGEYTFIGEIPRKASVIAEEHMTFFNKLLEGFKTNNNNNNNNNNNSNSDSNKCNSNKEMDKSGYNNSPLKIENNVSQDNSEIHNSIKRNDEFFPSVLKRHLSKITKQNNRSTVGNETNGSNRIKALNETIDWATIKKSRKYNEFLLDLGELKKTSLEKLNLSEQISFWVNIYNSLLIHGAIINGSIPESNFHLKNFNSQYKYKISGYIFSRDDIFQGILKACTNYFPKNDPRRQFVLPKNKFIPLILFALTNIYITSPQIQTFHSKDLDKELLSCCKNYIQDFVHTQETSQSRKIILPNLFKWNLEIFGGSDDSVIKFILQMLSLLNTNLYQIFIQITKNENYIVEYQDISFYSKHSLKNSFTNINTTNKNTNNYDSCIINNMNQNNSIIEHTFSFTGNIQLEQTFQK